MQASLRVRTTSVGSVVLGAMTSAVLCVAGSPSTGPARVTSAARSDRK